MNQHHFGRKIWWPSSFWESLSGRNKLSNVGSLIILPSGEVFSSFNKENSANVAGEKKVHRSFLGCLFFENMWKNLIDIINYFSLVVIVILESKYPLQLTNVLKLSGWGLGAGVGVGYLITWDQALFFYFLLLCFFGSRGKKITPDTFI